MSETISVASGLIFGTAALASLVYGPMNTAVSNEARITKTAVSEVLESRERSQALFGKKADAISSIAELLKECSSDDWDGYGASAINSVVSRNAEGFIKALPDNITMPDISPDPDGSISIDWSRSRNHMVSVSIGVSNRLAIAWLDGTERGHAVVNFDGVTTPRILMDKI